MALVHSNFYFIRADRQIKSMAMTMLELMLAMVVIAIACLGLLVTLMSTSTMSDITSEEMLATNAIQAQMAIVKAEAKENEYATGGNTYTYFDAMLKLYTDNSNNHFNIDGLDPETGNSAGSILLYMSETNIPSELGGTQDLNGDGDSTDDLATPSNGVYDMMMVPVEIKVTWRNKSGNLITTSRFMMIARTE